jgi:hypothetical protein
MAPTDKQTAKPATKAAKADAKPAVAKAKLAKKSALKGTTKVLHY